VTINYRFTSDNTAPAAPEVLAALAAVNEGSDAAYGEDAVTARLQQVLAAAFEREPGTIHGWPALNGKAANHLALLAITEPGGLIFCHEGAHIRVDEDDGPARYTQTRLVPIEDDGAGRIAPDALARAIAGQHPVPPGSALSVTNTTEAGTLYQPDELRRLVQIGQTAGLKLHYDGARIANAAAALGCSLADLTWRSSFDILSLGVTKNGGMMAEAVVCFGPATAARFEDRRRWTGHVASKMRFLSAQVIAGIEGDGWRRRAANANRQAARLAAALAEVPGYRFARPVETNHLFLQLSPARRRALASSGYQLFDWEQWGAVRILTNWSTTDDEVDTLAATLRRIAAEHP
jgi:threonine aldolase